MDKVFSKIQLIQAKLNVDHLLIERPCTYGWVVHPLGKLNQNIRLCFSSIIHGDEVGGLEVLDKALDIILDKIY